MSFCIRCPYCGGLTERSVTDDHLDNCDFYPNPLACFSCGKTEEIDGISFSNSQRAKECKARCQSCVSSGNIRRFEPFTHLYRFTFSKIDSYSPSARFLYAVSDIDVDLAFALLEEGVDVNVLPQKYYSSTVFCYDEEGNAIYDEDGLSALDLCVFRMSDCMLDENQRQRLCEMAVRFIAAGADKQRARSLYVSRYGRITAADIAETPNDAFVLLYQLLQE